MPTLCQGWYPVTIPGTDETAHLARIEAARDAVIESVKLWAKTARGSQQEGEASQLIMGKLSALTLATQENAK